MSNKEMVKVWLVRPDYTGPEVVLRDLEQVAQTLEDSSVGDTWLVKYSEMSLSDIEALPEFEGW